MSNYFEALAAVRKPMFLKTPKHREQHTRAERDGADPDILEFERRMVKRMEGLGVPMFAHCVIRTEDEQRALFREGFSNDSPDDGLWPHQGYAVDLIHGVLGWEMPRKAWEIVGEIADEISVAASIPIVWGGRFKRLWDPAHFELADWRERAAANSPGR